MTLRLCFHPLSSFCQKVLIALYENDTPFQQHIVDLAEESSRAEFLEVWPIGKFPARRSQRSNDSGVEHHHRVPGAALSGQDAAGACGRGSRA